MRTRASLPASGCVCVIETWGIGLPATSGPNANGAINMKRIGTAIIALCAFAATANAGEDPYAVYYKNTYVITSSKNVVIKIHANKDGTWTSTTSDGKPGRGQWAGLGKYTCVSDAAMVDQKPDCSVFVTHKLGDTWTEKAPDGTTDTMSLTAGR